MAAPGTTATGAAPTLRQFAFFDVVPVRDIHDLAASPELFKVPGEISCLTSSSVGLLLADIQGSVHLLSKDFESARAWVVQSSGRVTHMVEKKGVLVTLGEDPSVRFPLLKVWDLHNFDKRTGAPMLLRSIKVQHSNKQHPVSSVALSASLSHLAIGLGDGTVLLYRNLDQSLSTAGSLTALPKPKTLHESPTEPITGLGFREPTADEPALHIFVATTSRVLRYLASGKGSGGAGVVVDEIGAALGCAVMDGRARELVVAREEALYMCGTEGRGNCIVYEGRKSLVHPHQHYLVFVSPPFPPSASAASATVRNFAARMPADAAADITKVTVLDPENKFIAHSSAFTDGVRMLFSAWGKLYVLSNEGQLSCLEEKPMQAKLESLYRRGHYRLALDIARTQRLDPERVADIHREYGDHLYSKANYDGAMEQFVQTIGHLQPSYVIRKFLDAQRIHNLVTYLQELHALGLANSDHTTLLLNTYTKLKDVARLDNFIKTESRRTGSQDGSGGDDLPFDLDTAIRVCRQAGYFEHASYLARKYERHEDYLRIQIEDAGQYGDALAYLRRLGGEAAEANLARYGRAMLQNLPNETTQLLIDICTSIGPLTFEPEVISPAKHASGGSSYLSFMALNRGNATEQPAPPSPATPTATKADPRRQGSVIDDGTAGSGSGASTPPQQQPLKPRPVKRPSPRAYFAHFVDHLDRFVIFLETVALRRWGQSVDGAVSSAPHAAEVPIDEEADARDQAAVWNTLLELYLSLPADVPEDDPAAGAFRDKALRLLHATPALPYDATHALILCSSRAFTPGLVLLWEQRGMHEDVLRFWMDRHRAGGDDGASAQVVRYLNLYGAERPALYPLVLRFLTSTHELLARHADDVGRVLEHIEAEKIMSPVSVVQVLSRNGVASVGLVKQWLMTRIRESREEIQTDEKLIDSYRTETKTKQKQIEELSDPDHPRVFHVTRCSRCDRSLDLPAVHFMCNHSYHQRCLEDHESECPNCAQAHGVIREIRMNNERLADQHDVFLSDVRESGFEAVASAFGRGVMNMPRVEDVTA